MAAVKKTFLILLLIISNKIFAQSNFVNGFVTLSNNDTLKGYLKENDEGNLLKRVIFSNNENGSSSQEYSPTDIKAFYFNDGNLFESVTVTDINNTQTSYFAKYLLKGYYNLYTFIKKDLKYFVIKHGDTTYLLYDDILLNSGFIDIKGNYKNQLLFLSRNCTSLDKQIPQVSYNENDLIAFVHKINDCIAPGITSTSVKVNQKSVTRFYVYAGGLPLGNKYEITGRALLRISTPSISRNMALNVGLNYLGYKTTETISNKTVDHISNIVSAGLTVQNNFTTGIVQPYIEGGIGVSYTQGKDEVVTGSAFQNKYGVDFILAVGIEGYVTKKLAVKADWRYELLMHYPVIGVAYFF